MTTRQMVWLLVILFTPAVLLIGTVGGWVWLQIRRKGRRPLTDKLLRAPGESLRQRTARFDEQLEGTIFFMLLYGPIWFLLFVGYTQLRKGSPSMGIEIFGFGLVMVAVTVLIALRMSKALKRNQNDCLGARGERAVGEELNKLMLDGCLVYHDVPGDGAWNVDHVVVAPSGVYAIETKTRRKDPTAEARKDYEVIYDGKTLQFPTWTDTHGLDQAKANARWLAKHLSNVLQEPMKVIPILTFPGWMVTSRVRPNGNDLRVLNHKQIRAVIVNGSEPVLDDKRIKQIGYQLELKCRDVEF